MPPTVVGTQGCVSAAVILLSAQPLDARQVEEFTLTATQTLLGVAIILALRFHWWSALGLAILFGIQFAITDTAGRYVLATIQATLAVGFLILRRRDILPTLSAPFPADDTPAVRRQKHLLLDMTAGRWTAIPELRIVSARVANEYAGKTDKTIARDVNVLVNLGLLIRDKHQVRTNHGLMQAFLPVVANTGTP